MANVSGMNDGDSESCRSTRTVQGEIYHVLKMNGKLIRKAAPQIVVDNCCIHSKQCYDYMGKIPRSF